MVSSSTPAIPIGSPSTRVAKHEGYDRTGNYTSRTKITQELGQVINDGLRYYEEDLWTTSSLSGGDSVPNKSSAFRTVNLISKADFDKMTPPLPKAINPEYPPAPPPPPCNTPMSSSVQIVPPNLGSLSTVRETVGGAVAGGSSPRGRTRGPRKRSTRFYPVDDGNSREHNVGWIMDSKPRRNRTTSIGYEKTLIKFEL